MITTKVTRQIEHPHEAGVTFTIRKLSHHQLMMSEDERVNRAIDKAKRLGESMAHLPDRANADQQERAELPENKYNRSTVLQYGVTAWSYEEPLNEATVLELDEETAAWLFDEVMAFSLRSREEGEASGSNSAPITA